MNFVLGTGVLIIAPCFRCAPPFACYRTIGPWSYTHAQEPFDSAAMEQCSQRLRLCCVYLGVALLLLFVGARVFAEISSRRQIAAFERNLQAPDQSSWSRSRARAYAQALSLDLGEPVAVLRIPAVNLRVPVYGSDSERYLNRGVGVISGMHLPDRRGNVGIAGHRDGFFRALKDIARGDLIELQTQAGLRTYRVRWIQIVPQSDRHVLADTAAPSVTLVTCYPFYYIGSAPLRFVVHGELSE